MVYLAGTVGNFNPLWFGQGDMAVRFCATFMFVLTVFFCNVVFMNMLVAIMGESFNQVLMYKEESALREQV